MQYNNITQNTITLNVLKLLDTLAKKSFRIYFCYTDFISSLKEICFRIYYTFSSYFIHNNVMYILNISCLNVIINENS